MRRLLPLLVLAAASLCVAGVLGNAPASSGAGPKPVTLRATFSSFPDYLDPQLSYTAEGWTAMYDTYIPLLTFRHASGRAGADVVPGLAKALPEVSEDGRTYTLFLRRGLRYSDGTRVRASDFEYAVKRLFKLNSGAFPFYTVIVGARRYLRTKRGGISGIAANDRTGKIVIHLLRRDSTFAQLLAVPFAAPVPPDTPLRDQSFSPPPATGPYAIAKVGFRGWSYVRNPAWRSNNGKRMPELPNGHVGRIEVKVVRNGDAQVRGVLSGKFDWMQNPPPVHLVGELQRRYGGTRFRTESTLSTYYFWMNTRKPPFDDLRVRQAVNYAVDPVTLQRIYGGQISPTQQILPPGMPGYQQFELYPYDLEKARQMIAAADPSDRKITVWTDNESPNNEAGEYFRSQLQRIGFNARLKVVNADNYFWVIGNRSTPDLDTGWSDWFADYAHPDDFFRSVLRGSSILPVNNGNFAQIGVPALDAEIERLNRAPLGPAGEDDYAALDRSFMELAPWAPYGTRTLSTFVSRRVDLDKLVWNPLIGADLASLRFK